MAGKKPTHRLVMKDEYMQDGEKKTKWIEVLPLWEHDKGLTISLPKGMFLSGTLFIFKSKDEESTDAPGNVDDDLPF